MAKQSRFSLERAGYTNIIKKLKDSVQLLLKLLK